MQIEILKNGLTLAGTIYFAGAIVDSENPHPRLVELANGAFLGGEVVARLVATATPEKPAPPEPIPETPEAVAPQNNFKGGRKKR
jgi:hypothetical protein